LPAKNSSALSIELLATIRELQVFESLSVFALAGGTSLSIRFNHRHSYDIDLFTNQVIGYEGFVRIEKELKKFYNTSLIGCEIINTDNGDQFRYCSR